MIKKIYKKYEEIINYVIIGGLTTIVSIVSYTVFRILLNKSLVIAEILSWILAVTFAYITNKTIVFKSKKKSILKESISFFTSRILTLLLGIGILIVLEWIFPETSRWQMIAKFLQQLIILVLNYILSKLFVFKSGGQDDK